MRDQRANADVLIARVAARQHGVVSVGQLRTAGLDKHHVLRRTRTGRLHRIHRGVYAVGHAALSREGQWMAAVLAGGDTAALSHRSAAELWTLLPNRSLGRVDISVPGAGGKRRRVGIVIHRCISLSTNQITRRNGIPITTPVRTMLDLRRALATSELRAAQRRADVLGLSLGEDLVHDGTRSELEFRFLELCRRHRLPLPVVNTTIGDMEVDFVWPRKGLIVETDGFRYHRGRVAFETDRARDLVLRSLDYDVIRLSYRQVTDSPDDVVAVLRRALSLTS